MNNNDTSFNGGNNNISNQNGVGQNPNVAGPTPVQNPSLEGTSLGSVTETNVGSVQPPVDSLNANPSAPASTDFNQPAMPSAPVEPSNSGINVAPVNPFGGNDGTNPFLTNSQPSSVSSNPVPANPGNMNAGENNPGPNPVPPVPTGGETASISPAANSLGNNGTTVPPVTNNPMEPFGFNPEMNPNNNIIQSVPTPPMMNMTNQNGPTSEKKKKGISKTTIVVLAILLICLIGAGIYYFLNFGNKKATLSISMKDLSLEMGKELSENASDYATVQGYDVSNCKVDTSKVNIREIGSYDVTVTCGTTSKAGKVIVQDKTAPVVVVKELMVAPGTKVELKDFVVSCNDASNCSYELEDKSIQLDTLVNTEGITKFNVVVSDDYDNKTTMEVTLNVTLQAPVKYMYCTFDAEEDTQYHATRETSYNYGISENEELVSTNKIVTYTFQEEEDYQKAKNEYESTNELNGVSGAVVYDDDEFTITITTSITDLNKEFEVDAFPTLYSELKQYHTNQGISCKNR